MDQSIRERTEALERQTLSPRACLSAQSKGRAVDIPPCPMRTCFQRDIDRVVHFAAESHVDRSIVHPEVFVQTNVLGTAVMFMIPYCQYISLIPVTILCLVDTAASGGSFWTMWWECIATFAAVQVVGDLILTPRIMGKAMGLNPAIILLSLSIWGSLLGFVGMIIALPLTTLLLSYYEQYVIMRNNDEPPSQRLQEVKDIEAMADTPFEDD